METPDIEQPEKLRFVGKVKDPKYIEAAKEYLDTNVPPMPPELDRSKERDGQVQALNKALQGFARQELEIDLSKRLPTINQYHFFDDEGYQKVREMNNSPSGSVATYSTSGHMLMKEAPSLVETLGNANHELIHVTSYRSINLCELSAKELRTVRAHSGYQNERNKALSLLDEALTEITNIQVMAQHWGGQDQLRNFQAQDYDNIAYIEPVLIVDNLIKKAASNEGREYREVLTELQKGKFLGQAQALRVLTRTIGKEGMKKLAKLIDSPEEAISFASEMQLADAEDKIKKLHQGEKVDLLENITPDISIQLPKPPKRLG